MVSKNYRHEHIYVCTANPLPYVLTDFIEVCFAHLYCQNMNRNMSHIRFTSQYIDFVVLYNIMCDSGIGCSSHLSTNAGFMQVYVLMIAV